MAGGARREELKKLATFVAGEETEDFSAAFEKFTSGVRDLAKYEQTGAVASEADMEKYDAAVEAVAKKEKEREAKRREEFAQAPPDLRGYFLMQCEKALAAERSLAALGKELEVMRMVAGIQARMAAETSDMP